MSNDRVLEPALVIVYRQLVLFHGTNKGVEVLLPSENHDGTIRDIRSDSTWALSEAKISLLANGRTVDDAAARVYRNNRLLNFNLIVGETVRPKKDPLPLNARIHIPGGTLTAYPSSAFPEFAEDEWHFPRPKKNGTATDKHDTADERPPLPHRVTDTCIFSLPLDPARTYHLQIESPRHTVQIEVSGSEGRRFEVKNADRKLGKPPASPFDLRDYHHLAALLDVPALPSPLPPAFMRQTFGRNFMCDEIVVCPDGYCGNDPD